VKEFMADDCMGLAQPGAVTDAIDIAESSAAGRHASASLAFVLGLFGAVWAASGAMSSLVKAVNAAYDRIETRPLQHGLRDARRRDLLLLWLYYSAMANLFGVELNAELDRQADIRAAGGPEAGLVKPARRAS